MKFLKRFATILAALAICAMAVVPAFANNYDPIHGTDTLTLTKYLVMKPQAEVPGVTFTFTMSGLENDIEATESTVKVYHGHNPELVKINDQANTAVTPGSVTFTAGEATTNGPLTGVTDDVYTKYASKTLEFDFTDVVFTEPGVYRYYVTENVKPNGAPYAAITNDTSAVRTIDVYIEDGNGTDGHTAGTLFVKGYIVYDGTVTAAPNVNGTALTTKTDKYVNKYTTYDLTFGKTVTGNQGSRDQYFAIKLNVANAGAGTVLTLVKDNMETSTHANTATAYTTQVMNTANQRDDDANKTGAQLICDAQGAAEMTIYLHHGQTITVQGLPVAATWSIEETDPAYGYTKTYTNESGSITAQDEVADVTNARSGQIPTGIIATLGLGAALVAAAGAGFVVVNRRKSDED